MGIVVLTTGGTIGALPYSELKNPPTFTPMPPAGTDLVCDALKKSLPSFRARCLTMQPLDSKAIDDDYRENLMSVMRGVPEQGLLLTHGTDTLLETADYFYAARARLGKKKLIITGSMVPLANMPESEGLKNLEFSLQLLTNSMPVLPPVGIVLCDYDDNGAWMPRFYHHQPGAYKKFYDPQNACYNRLVETRPTGV